ncbi:Hypothetical protein, putative [Bodo saltans]|uniref:Uncharacterized protein n=1 Tax=Bodo saltans TaxID=75058 RepID=A0A0S4J7J4_BODSA|nr:Hypothetical protein, putative [Bodo saltans]|eukprot:CUG77108.1 Hypothetical protein, putative [Bodo saltans]
MQGGGPRTQKVVQCSFRSLAKAQREALLTILSSLGDDEITTMQHRAHGEVTLEWRVAHDHPILGILPEPSVYSAAARSGSGEIIASQKRVAADEQSSSLLSARAALPAHSEQRVLRDGRAAVGSSPRGRNISPAAAAARRGAAARNRSHSPRPVSVSSPFRGTTPDARPAQRSVQWACRTIDEVLNASRRLRVDTTRTTTVEELIQHVLTNRYGATPATRKMCGELASAAQNYSDVSPLCLLHSTYCHRRTSQDVKEFILVAKVVGALAPWSSRESVRTASSSSQHIVALRRYIAEGDISLALRDAVAVMLRKGSTLASSVRKYVTQWLRRPTPNPPIAFDFSGHVDGDALAVVLMEGLREAKAEAQRMQQEYGEFLHVGARGHSPDLDAAADDFDDDNGRQPPGLSAGDFNPFDSAHVSRIDRYLSQHDGEGGTSSLIFNHSAYDAEPTDYARRQHVQSEDLVDVILQRRRLEEARDAELAALRQGESSSRQLRNRGHIHQPSVQQQQQQQQHHSLAQVLHRQNDGRGMQSASPPRPQFTSSLPQPTAFSQHQQQVRQTPLHSFANQRDVSPALGRATKSSPLVVTLPPRQQQQPDFSHEGYSSASNRLEDDDSAAQLRKEGARPRSDDHMGALMAQRERAILHALDEQIGNDKKQHAGAFMNQRLQGGHEQQRHRASSSSFTERGGYEQSPPPQPHHHDSASTPHHEPHAAHHQPSPLASSPFQADLSDMRSTLQAIEDELRRRQSGPESHTTSQSFARDDYHRHHKDPFADRYEFGRAPKPPLVSPPRPHAAELFPRDRHEEDYYHNHSGKRDIPDLPPRSVPSYSNPIPLQKVPPLAPAPQRHAQHLTRGSGGGTLEPSQGLQDDERLLLEQLETSLRARRAQQQQQPLPTPRRPLEMIAEPL